MRMASKVLAGVAVVGMLALTTGVAVADPINAKNPWKHGAGKLYYPGEYNTAKPRYCDVVGSGSNTIVYLMQQYSLNYNSALVKAHKSQTASCSRQKTPFFYSWDALQNAAATTSPNIVSKPGCTAAPRPNGSSAGVAALAANVTVKGHSKNFCWDFARSSRARKTTDPTNVTFVPLALDNVTYASVKGSNAPSNLTTKQLDEIYTCTVTNWNQVGGPNATIHPLLPQPNSGTLAFFENAIGGPTFTPGSCVTQPATLEENEGVDPIFTGPNAKNEIVPFSAGKYVSQGFHSPKCAKASCPADSSGVFIKCMAPKKGQNDFGCDVNGSLVLDKINGKSPITGTGSKTHLNSKFSSGFVRALYAVVRGTNRIPTYLLPYFGRHNKNSLCNKTNQTKVIPAYGFEPNPACGVANAF